MKTLLPVLFFGSVIALSACDSNREKAAPESTPASASSWSLDADASQLSFVSIKNNQVAETHRFRDLSGSLAADGAARIEIGLDSVVTGVEIRDLRLRETLFQTAQFPKAVITAQIDPALVKALAIGAHQIVETEAQLDLHGLQNKLPATLRITRIGERLWLVTSEKPLIVNAANFGLVDGLETLRNVVNLQSIGAGVPVDFTLSFKGA